MKINKSKLYLEFTVDDVGNVEAEAHNSRLPLKQCKAEALDIVMDALGTANVNCVHTKPKRERKQALKQQNKQETGG